MASIEGGLTDGHLAINGWQKALLLVATVSTLAAALITFGGLTAANESVGSAVGAGHGDLPANCREAIVLPKRGWVCMEGMSERFDSSPGSGAAHQQLPVNPDRLKPHRIKPK
jgi:hypothetical protein